MKAKAKKSSTSITRKRSSKSRPSTKRSGALEGEGSYTASRNYDRGTETFIANNRAKITKMAKDAERALDGPEGKTLRAAEKAGKSKARR